MCRRLGLAALSQVHHNPSRDNRDNDRRRYQPDRAPAATVVRPAVASPTMASATVAGTAAASLAAAVCSADWHGAMSSRAATGSPRRWPVTVAPVLAIGVRTGHRMLPRRGLSGVGRGAWSAGAQIVRRPARSPGGAPGALGEDATG